MQKKDKKNITKRWKHKLGVLVVTAAILTLAAAEQTWGLSSLWKGIWEKDVIIAIDAGHGGADPGAISQNEAVLEKDVNLAIAVKLQGYLQEAGYTVVMTRTEDEDLAGDTDGRRKTADMKERIRVIEEAKSDLMISIHQNSFPEEKYHGPQVFFQSHSEEAAGLAMLVQGELNVFSAPGNSRQAKSGGDYYILKNAPMTAILVECGFVSNPEEAALLKSDSYQRKIAWGIYSGMEKYLQSAGL